MYYLILVTTFISLAGCATGISEPWTCECSCDANTSLRCTGVTGEISTPVWEKGK